jgi:hypothetical protein
MSCCELLSNAESERRGRQSVFAIPDDWSAFSVPWSQAEKSLIQLPQGGSVAIVSELLFCLLEAAPCECRMLWRKSDLLAIGGHSESILGYHVCFFSPKMTIAKAGDGHRRDGVQSHTKVATDEMPLSSWVSPAAACRGVSWSSPPPAIPCQLASSARLNKPNSNRSPTWRYGKTRI